MTLTNMDRMMEEVANHPAMARMVSCYRQLKDHMDAAASLYQGREHREYPVVTQGRLWPIANELYEALVGAVTAVTADLQHHFHFIDQIFLVVGSSDRLRARKDSQHRRDQEARR
jgi:hypothetical protein